MDRQGDQPGMEGMTGARGSEGEEESIPGAGVPEGEKQRRKVSLIGAIVVNLFTLIILAIVLLAVLLPGYRRSFTVARAVRGAEEVWIVVRTTEADMRENSTDFLKAQDGLRNAIQEEVDGGGNNVWAYVRDNYPDRGWVEMNLPEGMRAWLEELFPQHEILNEMPGEVLQEMIDRLEEEQPAGEEQPPEEEQPAEEEQP